MNIPGAVMAEDSEIVANLEAMALRPPLSFHQSNPSFTPQAAVSLGAQPIDHLTPHPPHLPNAPKLVVYHQTHYANGNWQSALPLLTRSTGCTHVILAALHINWIKEKDQPPVVHLTLNDHAPDHPHVAGVWEEAKILQSAGIKVMILLGGAAPGTMTSLDFHPTSLEKNEELFQLCYHPVRDLLRAKGLDGIDLNVEEKMSDSGLHRLILQLRADFPLSFLIQLSPMGPGMQGGRDLSYVDYERLEHEVGEFISWYGVQFYNGWADASDPDAYSKIIARGFPEEKILLGLITDETLGGGCLDMDKIEQVLREIKVKHPRMGGVCLWEWFIAGGADSGLAPWQYVKRLRAALDSVSVPDEKKTQ